MTLQVAQRRDLEVHRAFTFTRRGNLEHVALAIPLRHAMVLVAFALQRRELAGQVPMCAGELDAVVRAGTGRD